MLELPNRTCLSPSPRRAWIEIGKIARLRLGKGSPSPRRAWIEMTIARYSGRSRDAVALPTEGVDRNRHVQPIQMDHTSPSPRRAWIEMPISRSRRPTGWTSPSPRRAWIEMMSWRIAHTSCRVALPTEGVDRNMRVYCSVTPAGVALPTEGVDRNLMAGDVSILDGRRPPHGGRG